MNTNDKTLADVQPGGRVRLGDQAERARFEAWPQAREFEIQKDGSGEYLSEVTHGAWLAWKYLSAQPSPGGQGDERELLAAEFDKNEVTAAAARRLRNHNETAVEAAALRVIAARQPVRHVRLPQSDLDLINEAAARQPVGEPVADSGRSAAYDAIDRFLRNNMDDAAYAEYVGYLEALYAAPPAQGWVVADGQGERWRMWGSYGPEWTSDRDQALHFARRADAEAFANDDEDAWLIQAVGNG